MSKYVIDSSTLTDIADAIRAKDGSTEPILVSALADAIANLPSGGVLFETGTIVTLDGTESPTIYHGLGVEPTMIIFATNAVSKESKICGGFYCDKFKSATKYNTLRFRSQYNMNPNYTASALDIVNIDEDYFDISTDSLSLIDGATYEWIALYFE